MKIPLPEEYSFKKIAKVEDEILHIFVPIEFEDLMYGITYATKETDRCYYCLKPLTRENSTLDHIYPRNLGGPSIPNNLCVSCGNCNSNKSNMFEKNFLTYTSLSNDEKKKFYKDYNSFLHFLKKWYVPIMPNDWVTYERIDKIDLVDFPYPFVKGKSYNKVRKFYKKYGRLYRAIIVDRNFKLLDGFNTFIFAKEKNISSVPVIILENVELNY